MKYILEYNEYNSSGRGYSLSEIEFVALLNEKCSEWVNNPKPLVRFKDNESDEFSIIQPSKYNRKSLNNDNYVVMLMDNLPSWSDLPKRSESIIFYNRNTHNDIFGNHLYFVIPFDNANFGKAPSDDLWEAVNDLNGKIALDKRFSGGMFNIDAPILYKDFYNYMNIEFVKSDFSDNKIVYTEFLQMRKDFFDSQHNKFMDFFNEYMSPSNFVNRDDGSIVGYKSVNYSNLTDSSTEQPKECWTDSDCLVYYAGIAKDAYAVNKKYSEFIELLNV